MTRLFLTALLLWLATGHALAQTLPILPQNPASLRWYELKTPHFNVLYPEGFADPAQRTARRLEQVYEPVSASLGRQPRRLSVLLQNQTTVSNGFVTVLPRRSEFFTTAPQDPFLAGTLNWLDLLAVHEFRHVVQYEKGLTGLSNVARILFGNSGLAFARIGLPDWFMEGDAVGAETGLTTGGRGRMPNFDLGLRANLLAGRRFSYQKAVGGSFVDNVPDHYPLGYFLTSYLKREFGASAFDGILQRYYNFFFYPFSFSNEVKGVTKLRVEGLYDRTMTDLTETWQQQQQALPLTDATIWPAKTEKVPGGKAVFTNYEYPQFLTDSTLVCLKSGLGDISQLVTLTRHRNGTFTEKRLFVQGFVNDPGMLSAGGGKVCWIEFGFDPRWGQRVYGDIRLLDVATGKLTRLTRHGRYTAAALSPDGSRVVAVQNDADHQTRLVVLDARPYQPTSADPAPAVADTNRLRIGSAKRTVSRAASLTRLPDATPVQPPRELPNSGNRFYVQPRWMDAETIVSVVLDNGQKSIELIDNQTGQTQTVLSPTPDNISHAQPWGRWVLFNSPRSGIDNLFAVSLQTGQVRQVSSRPLAAYHAAVSPANGEETGSDGTSERLAFHEFTADGFRLAEMPLDTSRWLTPEAPKSALVRYFGPLSERDPGAAAGLQAFQTDTLAPATPYPVSRYRRLAHALNIYGYGPLLSSSGQTLTVGLNSQDLLGTTQLSAGYAYNQSERTSRLYAALSYQGLYPVLDLNVERGNRNTAFYIDRAQPLDSLRSTAWTYNQLSAGMRLPLNLTRSKYGQSLSLSAYYNYLQVNDYALPQRLLTEVGPAGSLHFMTFGLSYAALLKQSRRDVAPSWGLTASLSFRNTPFGGTLQAQQTGLQGSVYLPGLLKHHSLRLRGAFQQQWGRVETQQPYLFSAAVFYPRGLPYIGYDQFTSASAEYRFPVADTHWSLGRVLYVQRIKSMLFADAVSGQVSFPTRTRTGQIVSIERASQSDQMLGADLTFVFNFLRLRTPFEAGVRGIYNVRTGKPTFDLLVLDIGF
jgi:hypothetical protein